MASYGPFMVFLLIGDILTSYVWSSAVPCLAWPCSSHGDIWLQLPTGCGFLVVQRTLRV